MRKWHHIGRRLKSALVIAAAMIAAWQALGSIGFCAGPGKDSETLEDRIAISQIEPDRRGGRAYKLVYWVKAPVEVYWRFKTDFDNDFLLNNDYIKAHRLVSRNGQSAITEDRYANNPEVAYRWQTTMVPGSYRLDFVLLNPEQCGQKFHYGRIQLEAVKDATRVTQVAYFDFWGVSFWTYYPWKGGMRDFLEYTARWEQAMIQQLKPRYVGPPMR